MAHKVAVINGKQPSAGVGGVSDADLSNLAVNFFSKGVVSPAHYRIDQQGSPNMTVKVNTGTAYTPNPGGTMLYQSILDASVNATIGANASGNPRIDAVCIKIDTGTTPDNLASNIATIVVVAGTPGASPSAPSDSTIQSSVGGSNGFLRLANVTVANGASSITTANIADTRTNVSLKNIGKVIVLLTDGATINTDVSLGDEFRVTLGGNRTLANPTNMRDGDRKIWRFKQDGTGTRTITLGSAFRLGTDISAVTLTTTINKADYLGAIYNQTDDKWDVVAFIKGY